VTSCSLRLPASHLSRSRPAHPGHGAPLLAHRSSLGLAKIRPCGLGLTSAVAVHKSMGRGQEPCNMGGAGRRCPSGGRNAARAERDRRLPGSPDGSCATRSSGSKMSPRSEVVRLRSVSRDEHGSLGCAGDAAQGGCQLPSSSDVSGVPVVDEAGRCWASSPKATSRARGGRRTACVGRSGGRGQPVRQAGDRADGDDSPARP
jgi:hypothetical protein